jgi:fumarate hydratase class I
MYKEANTKNNLPAQVDIASVQGDAYKFLFMAKGGGSANKTALFPDDQGRTEFRRDP